MKAVTSIPPKPKLEKGEFGIARVSMFNDSQVKLEMKASGNVFMLTRADLPAYFPWKEQSYLDSFLTLDETAKTVMYAMPARGDYDAKFICFGWKEDEPPTMNTNQYGISFSVMSEITTKAWAGSRATTFFNFNEKKEGYNTYNVLRKDENGNVALDGFGKGHDALVEFMKAVGVYDMDFPYSENPLPAWQKAIKEVNRKYIVSLSFNALKNRMDVSIQSDFAVEAGLSPLEEDDEDNLTANFGE